MVDITTNKLLFIVFIIICAIGGTTAQTFSDSDWQYYRTIEINNSGTTLTDYQILINLNGSSFPDNANINGSDIRFTDFNGLELNYWIESWNYSKKSALIWVNVKDIFSYGNTNINLWYGNPNAISLSNKDSVFPLYDFYSNFSGWSSNSVTSCGSYGMMGGYNIFGNGASTQKTINNLKAGDYIVSFDYYHIDSWDGESGRFFWNDTQIWSRAHNLGGSNICGGGWGDSNGLSYATTLVIINHTGGNATLKFDSTLNQGASDESWGVNNITVRKYAASIPQVLVKEEQIATHFVRLTIFPKSKITYPEYFENFTLWIYNNQSNSDNFTLSCTETCTFSENPVFRAPYQNSSINVTIISKNISGTTSYIITANNTENSSSTYATITVDATKWRTTWNDAYNNEFNYRIPITIKNNNSQLNNYQVKINLDTASLITGKKFKEDCGDIRFTDGTYEIPYWIESGCNTYNTKFWVNVPFLPENGTSTIYMYFGNSNVSYGSNGLKTFEFFDDFNGNNIDTNKWEGDISGFSVFDGELKGNLTSNRLQSIPVFSSSIIQEVKARTQSLASNGHQVAGFYSSSSDSFGILEHPSNDYYRNNGGWTAIGDVVLENNVSFKIIIKSLPTNQINYTIQRLDNGAITRQETISNSILNEKVALGERYDNSYTGQAYLTFWDNIFIRKYAQIEPEETRGLIESSSGSPVIDKIRVYPISPNVSDNIFISSQVADSNILWVNFTLKYPDGTVVINNTKGTQNGNIWNSSTALANRSGWWHYTITAKDVDGNIDTVNGIFMVKTIINGDWTVIGNEVQSGQEIILNGNLIIPADANLSLNNVKLVINGASKTINVNRWGKLFVSNNSEIIGNYNYNFYNYGYLNIQNSLITKANSINFYDTSDDTSVINGSRITETSSDGVYMYYASPNITNNVITNIGRYAIFADQYSSPIIENNIIKDNLNGDWIVYFYHYSSPRFINNTISGNSYGILSRNYASPLIENNTIINNGQYGIYSDYSYNSPIIKNNLISGHSNMGIYFPSSNSYPLIVNNIIENNGNYGIYLSGTSATIENNTLRNHRYGIRADSWESSVSNSTINSLEYDYYIYNGGISSTNTKFNKSKVYVINSGFFDVFWYDTISVHKDYLPVNSANVEIYDNDGFLINKGITDIYGNATLKIQEYIQTTTKVNFTPHLIKAVKNNESGSIYSNITETKYDFVGLGNIAGIPEPISKNGDWIINNTQSYTNKKIILNGNLIIQSNGSLNLDNSTLFVRLLRNGQYNIEIQNGGRLIFRNSTITSSYPELGFYYNFYNRGYLNIQNSTISKANSINFYDSSDDTSVINGSRIIETSSDGVYMYYASPNITNNVITNIGRYAIFADQYSSPLIENNIIKDNLNGNWIVYFYHYSSPRFINNTISGNSYGILSRQYASPLIENNNITNNGQYGIYSDYSYNSPIIKNNLISGHSNVGIYFPSSNSYPLIVDNIIENNGNYGIYLSQTSATIENNTIQNHRYGVRADYWESTINNSTINSTQYDFYFYSSGKINSINTKFNKSKVYFQNAGGILDVFWYEKVNVIHNLTNISSANVEVFDSEIRKVTNGTTDANGSVTFRIREYTQRPDATSNANPHKLKASKLGYPNGSIESNITSSKTDVITLGNEIYIPEPPMTINGNWFINDTQSYSDRVIIVDNGNVIVNSSGLLALDNVILQLRYNADSGYKIENRGRLFLNNSNVNPSYPELGFYYNFYNYGYLNIQNSSIRMTNSIRFYDSSDDNSTINQSLIIKTSGDGIHTYYASPRISNNVFQNIANIGIYLDSYSSPNITNNTFTAIGRYAIYAYDHSSPLIENNTIKNNLNGDWIVYFNYYSSPRFINNTISGNSYGVLSRQYASPLIENNNITNNGQYGIYSDYSYNSPIIKNNLISGHSNMGIYFPSSNSYPLIIDNIIENNGNYGIYLSQTSATIENNTIQNHRYGVRADYWESTINNSTINSTQYDFYFYSSGKINSINTTYDKSKVYFYNAGGILDVYWYEKVNVIHNSTNISGANVEVFDKDMSIIDSGFTDSNGSITFKIRDYIQVPGASLSANPHKLRASKVGYPNGSIESAITNSKTDVITLGIGSIISEPNMTIKGDWIVNDTKTYSNKNIFLEGNLIIQNGGSLTLNNVTLFMKLVSPDQYRVDVNSGGRFNLLYSNITPAYPQLGFYYNFNVNGYLDMQNSMIERANYVRFYDSSNDNSTIINSVIKSNKDYGLYTSSASPTFKNNRIERTTGYGIYVYSSNPIIQDNVIQDNVGGILIRYSSSPLVERNAIINNGANGIYSDNNYNSPTIKDNTITDHTDKGIFFPSYGSYPKIINNTILRSGNYGIYVSQTGAIISDNTISNQGYGIRTDYWRITSKNNSIQSSSNYDYYIYSSGSIDSINTTFNKNKVYFSGSGDLLDVSWHLDVKAIDANSNPISDANISVKNLSEAYVFNGSTDAKGLAKNIVVKEYSQTNAGKIYFTPHNISAEFNGTSNTTLQNIEQSKEISIVLPVNLPLKVTILEPLNNSLFVQGDIIKFNALGFDPIDGILNGSSLNWISNLDGYIGSGDLFNSSSLSIGKHKITVNATNSNGASVYDSVNVDIIGRSDLIVENINITPRKINEGELVTFNASIKNIGDGYTPSEFYIRFYVDYDYIGQAKIERLNASQSVVITQTWIATAYAQNVTVVADYYDHIHEKNEGNNRLTTQLTDVEQADLIISSVNWTPEIFYDGTFVTFNAQIKNIGIGNASKPFDVGFYINGVKIGTVSINSLGVNSSTNISQGWTATTGNFVLSVVADETNRIVESNESNNNKVVTLPSVYLADLIVSNIIISSNINDGETVIFNATIKNAGLNNTENWFGVRFYVDGIDIGYVVINGLSAGNSSNVSKTWTATTGLHNLTVTADADGWYGHPYNAYGPRVSETDETNNTKVVSLPEVKTSDLIVSELSWSPSNFSDGQTVTFNAVVRNIGIGNTTRGFYTRFLIDGVNIGEKYLVGISSNSSSLLTQTWSATPGEHTISAVVDVYNQINEVNESNNTIQKNLTKIDLSDLIVSELNWSPSNFSDGQTVTFNAVVRNIGIGNTTRGFYTRFLIDGVSIGEKYLAGISSNSSSLLTQTWSATPGEHTISVVADVYNYINEENESNNTIQKNLTKVEGADLIISNLVWTPLSFSDGEVVTFNATLRNIGIGNTTRGFYTRFLIDDKLIGEKYLAGISSNSSVNLIQVWPASPGNHSVKVLVDFYNNINEENETNNLEFGALADVKLADFIVSNLTWSPYNFSDGEIVIFNASIMNIGTGNTTRQFYIGFSINDNSTGRSLVSGLSSGEEKQVSLLWVASSGNNIISAIADPDNYITESNKSNNNLSRILPSVTQPDIVISGITLSNQNISDGDNVMFNITVANIGVGNTSRNSLVQLQVNDTCDCGVCVQRWFIPGLNSGNSLTFEMPRAWTAKYGLHNINVSADVSNSVSESNETNNLFSILVQVNDTHPPLLLESVPKNSSIVRTVSNISVNLSDKLGSGVNLNASTIALYRGGNLVSGTKAINGSWLVFVPDASLVDGEYVISVNGIDKVGNSGILISNFTVDKTAPTVIISGVTEGSLYEVPVTPVIEITDLNLLSTTIRLNGVSFINGTTINSDGSYILTASGSDKAGNNANSIVNFSVDVKPTPPTGLTVYRTDTTAQLSWDANIELDISGYNVYRDGVKQNSGLIRVLNYNDVNLSANVSYIYTITAVDNAGHESDRAGVSPINIKLEQYGSLINGVSYLTENFADSVKINISNEGNSSISVNSGTIEAIDSIGDVKYKLEENSFNIPSAQSVILNRQILTGSQTQRLKVTLKLSNNSQVSRIFNINLRQTDNPVIVPTPTLLEGYRDAIEIRLTNYGSAPLNINPQELIIYLKDANRRVISQGRGEGSWIIISPNTSRRIPAFINTPIAEGNVSLGNLSIDITLPTHFGTGLNGHTFNLSMNANTKYQTVLPIEIYHPSLIKGGTSEFGLVFVNQGTGELDVAQGNAIIRIRNSNGTIIATESSDSPKATILPDSTQRFLIQVTIPSNASDSISIEGIIKAGYWTLDNSASELRFNVSKLASTVKPPYNANANTNKLVYNRAENVTINGKAIYDNGTSVSNASIRLKIASKGFNREFMINADSNGDYTHIFKPSDTEAGRYIVSATHPAIKDIENDAEFEVLGLYIMPLPGRQLEPFAPPVNLEMSQNDIQTVSVIVRNLGESNLTNINFTIIDNAIGDGVSASTNVGNFNLTPKDSRSVNVNVTASMNTSSNATFILRVASNEGSFAETTLSVKLHSAIPILVIEPTYIQTGSKPNDMQIKTVTLSNNGHKALQNVTLVKPSTSWISILTNLSLGSINPGERKTFDIMIAPTQNTSFGVYEDNIRIQSDNYPDSNFQMRVFVTSAQTGNIKFTVKNQIGDVLSNADVSIVDTATYTQLFKGKTDSNGILTFENIPTGRYSYKVTLPLHGDAVNTGVVEASTTTNIDVMLSYTFLQIEWSVTPTKIKDVYEITHNITYDSRAPIPYVKMDTVMETIYMVPGATYHGNVTLTNMNDIVSVLNLTPFANINNELVTVEFMTTLIPELKPRETITIPFVVKLATHHSPTPKACDTYSITITLKSEKVCLYSVNGQNVYTSVPTDTMTINIKPSCIDFIKDGALCAADLLSGGAVTGYDWLTKPLQAKDCIDTASNCILNNNYCNLWQGTDCAAGLYGCVGGPFSSCLSAANSLAKCLFQDECCGDPPAPPTPYTPPSGGGGGWGGWGGWGGGGLPPYTPSPWVVGPCVTSPETMCIRAKLEIKQELTFERQAFEAMLKLKNIRPDYDMTNVSVNVTVNASDGSSSTHAFFINVTSLEGIQSVDNGNIDSNSTATMNWLMIPTLGAGGTKPEGVKYTVMATIRYKVKGVDFVIETWPDEITVEPMPKLTLDYMLPRQVYGDDPMTQGIIEPAMPFMWGVRVNNSGYGPANNLAIDSAQPKIVESTAGAYLNFKLLGTYVNGTHVPDTLKVNFGNVQPGTCVAAGWSMMASLSGNFTNYTATFKHSDALGGEATSLLENVNTHVLVHEFMNDQPGKDMMYDFIIDKDVNRTNETAVPDWIIDSQCNDEPITNVIAIVNGTMPSSEKPDVKVVLNNTPTGWVYVSVDDVLNGKNRILKIVRSDGKVLSQYNYWMLEGKIYFTDYNPKAEYTVIYKYPKPLDIGNVTVLSISDNSAVIEWDTNIGSDSLVKYGNLSLNYTLQKYNASNVTHHNIGLTGLSENTTYYFVVNSTDLDGNTNESKEYNFTTQPKQSVVSFLKIDYPLNGTTVAVPNITVSGTASINVVNVTVNGIMANGTTNWSANITLVNGTNAIRATGTYQEGVVIDKTIYVNYNQSDILAYYRGLGNYTAIVETTDLLKAADDWSFDIAPVGFSKPLTTQQLLMLAEEWKRS